MSTLLVLGIILTTAAASPTPESDGVEYVLRPAFDLSGDVDFDGWPDGWTRQRGNGFPHYVGVKLDPAGPPGCEGSLRVEINGGSAAAYSPAARLNPHRSFVFDGWIRTDGLKRNEAYFSLNFRDERGQTIEVVQSERVRGTTDWTRVRLGPLRRSGGRAVAATIGVHVVPGKGQDVRGAVRFGGLRLGQLPSIDLRSEQPFNLFDDPGRVALSAVVSGNSDPHAWIELELLDGSGRRVDHARRLRGEDGTSDQASAAPSPSEAVLSADTPTDSLATKGSLAEPSRDAASEGGSPQSAPRVEDRADAWAISWRPRVVDYGYYRASVTLRNEQNVLHAQAISLAVLRPLPGQVGREWGWTLPEGEGPIPLGELPQFLERCAVGAVKLPMWSAVGDDARLNRLVALERQLSARRMELVGLLGRPNDRWMELFAEGSDVSAADLFSSPPATWYPLLEPVLAALSPNVVRWQLGRDGDLSYLGDNDAAARVAQVRQQFATVSPEMKIILGGDWLYTAPHSASPPWGAIQFAGDPPLTAEELATQLESTSKLNTARLVVLEPLPADAYDDTTRVRDLVARMIAVKAHGGDGAFVPQPMGENTGLCHADGSPGRLLMAWRTTSWLLSGSRWLGSLPLSGGSENHLFVRNGMATMFLWSQRPRRETWSFDEGMELFDIDGRSIVTGKASPRVRGEFDVRETTIEVGPLPVVVTGIPEGVARMIYNLALKEPRLPSILGSTHANALRLVNGFPQGVTGRIELDGPAGWRLSPRRFDFKLAPGETLDRPLEIGLPADAGSGAQRIEVTCELQSDRAHRFRVDIPVEVGNSDVTLTITSQYDAEGNLVVEQQIMNQSAQPVEFRCDLFAAGRRRLRSQVVAPDGGVDARRYVLERGAELAGQTIWIRAEEVSGPRILSQRHKAPAP